jgi:hypothetical protein
MMDRLLVFAFLFGGVLALASCSDPTGVGEELVGSEGQGAPQAIEAVPDSLDTATVPSETGINFPPPVGGNSDRTWRFLAGAVQDPIAGVIEAQGYVDFLGSASRSGSIQTAIPDSLNAELRLRPTYLHGDTLSTLEVNLFELSAEAEMERAPADTSFSVGPQLGTTYSVTPTDSLVTLSLPDSWIRDHLAPIQSDTAFGTAVNGFKIAAATEPTPSRRQVVVGFDHGSATLRVTSPSDTVDFRALKSFTQVDRRGAPEEALDDWTLLQDGVGRSLQMEWKFDRPPLDTLRNTPLNQAEITIPIDTETMNEFSGGNAFVRPSVNGYRVLATRAENVPGCGRIGLPRLPQDNQTCVVPTDPSAAPAFARMTSQAAFRIFDQALFETPLFTTFRVEIAVRETANASPQNALQRGLPSTLPVLVRTAETADIADRPRATLIVTPL